MEQDGRSDGPVKPEIFIGRLPPGIQKSQLENVVAPYGCLEVRHLDAKGCAFASFSTFAAAESAIEALHGSMLDGASGDGLNVKLADYKGVAKGAEQRPKIFVGGIGRTCTEDMLRQYCSQYGTVTYAKIFVKHNNSPPCAFVTFASFTEGERCIADLHGTSELHAEEGKILNCHWADIQKPPSSSSAGPRMMGSVLRPPPPPLPGAWTATTPSTVSRGPPSRLPLIPRDHTQPEVPKIFIGGLHPQVTEEFIVGMMAPFGDVTEAKLFVKPGRDPCGFVRFATEEQGHDAVTTLAARGRFNIHWADTGEKRPADSVFSASGPMQKRRKRP